MVTDARREDPATNASRSFFWRRRLLGPSIPHSARQRAGWAGALAAAIQWLLSRWRKMAISLSDASASRVSTSNESSENLLNIGVIGYGYWGPNIVRNFHGQQRSRVVTVCDKNPNSLQRVRQAFPDIQTTSDCAQLLTSPEIDAVAVVTPVWTHFELAKTALENGKHVFVEKPFTCTTAQAEELIELAERKHLKIMVDHTFLFTGAVKRMKEMIDDGTLGDLYYYDSTRVNLGLFQHDVNVLWDLAPHDLSIMDYLI